MCIGMVIGRALVVLQRCEDSGPQVDLLFCIRTHMKSVNCCHHIYNKNNCVVVFENVTYVALPGLSPSYEQGIAGV